MQRTVELAKEMGRTASAGGLRIAGAAASFALATVLSARLGAADAGLFYTTLNWATALAILGLWGAPMTLLHQMPPLLVGTRGLAAGSIFGRMMRSSFARLAMLCAPLVFAALFFGSDSLRARLEIVPVFVVLFASSLVALRMAGAAAKALGQVTSAMLAEFVFVPGLVLIALFAPIPFSGEALWSSLVAYGAALAIAVTVIAAIVIPRLATIRPTSRAVPMGWRTRQRVFAQIEIGQFLIAFGAMTVLPLVFDAERLGVLNLLLRIAAFVALTNTVVNSVFVPRLATIKASHGIAGCRPLLRSVHVTMAAIAVVAFMVVVTVGERVLVIAGPEFAGWSFLLPWTVAGFCLALLAGPVGTELALFGEERVARNTMLPLGVAGVATSLAAGWWGGIAWAAVVPGAFAFLSQLVQWQALRVLRLTAGGVRR